MSLIGALGGLLGSPYALMALALLGVMIAFLNLQGMRSTQGTELTTSAALIATCMIGVLCGLGHRVTPVAVAVITAGLLSWKERLAEFGHKLTAAELRSAILLGILAFAIYPVLPNHAVDHWGLIEPRAAWLTVLLIAGIGFANYILWKSFGTRGIELAGFLGGLVNSTVTVTELATRVARGGSSLVAVAYRAIVLSVAAMTLRNALLLGLLDPQTLFVSGASLGLMFVVSAVLALLTKPEPLAGAEQPLALESPFSLFSALKFGAIFLGLQVVGAVAQSLLGRFGFYAISFLGGIVSSASAVAAAATLAAHHKISPSVAGTGAVLATLASSTVNVVLVDRFANSTSLRRRVAVATSIVLVVGLAAAVVSARLS